MASDAEVLAAYRDTLWAIEIPGGTLHVRPGTPVEPGAIRLPAAVVTAYNPRSEPRAPAENRSADRRLASELIASGAEHHPARAHGRGPRAAEWEEPGYAVLRADLHEAVSLGAAFDQNAILWIDEAGMPSIVSTRQGFAGSEPGVVL